MQEQAGSKERNTPGAEEVLARVGGPSGLPFIAFLDGQGKLIVNSMQPSGADGKPGGNIGHPFQPSEIDWFLIMLRKGAPRMTPQESSAIEKWLRAQKK